MRYDITGHPLLSDDALDLTPAERAQHNDMAETLMGLDAEPLYVNDAEGPWGDRVKRFVALQVNWQVANLPLAFHQGSEGVGPLSTSWRKRMDGAQFTVHTLVADGMAQLRADFEATHVKTEEGRWKVLRSMRTNPAAHTWNA